MNVSGKSECNISEAESESDMNWGDYLAVGLLSILPVITITGNILVIVTVAKRRKFKQKANIFVVSLAAADLAVGIIVMPLATFLQYHSGKSLREFTLVNERTFCSMANSLDVMFTTTSILHLVCMTVDRYIAICLPLKYNNYMSRKSVILLLISCWTIPAVLLGLVLGGVHEIGIEQYKKEHYRETCLKKLCDFKVNVEYALIGSLISFYIPSIFMLFCNLKLFWYVKRRGTRLNKLTSDYILGSLKELQIRTEVKVAKTIAILLTCFFICWLPFFVVNVIDPFIWHLRLGSIARTLILWLGYVNSAINPYLYYFLNKPRRQVQGS